MKVFIPAIVGHVPDGVVQCVVSFMDFCYLARRSSHDTAALAQMELAHQSFIHHRQIFKTVNIRPEGFSLPRQHSLVHYVQSIKLFGSPNGLCSLITESKHITAVKKPWRASNRHNPLLQILQTNVWLSKISAARVDFGHRGMLHHSVLAAAYAEVGFDIGEDSDDGSDVPNINLLDENIDDEDAVDVVPGPYADYHTTFPARPAYSRTSDDLAEELDCPELVSLCRRFLYDQVYDDPDINSDNVDLDDCPELEGRIAIYNSATSIFYAPSETSGPGGMHQEMIRCAKLWRDCIIYETEI
ncbi:hypothetical protein NLI96_g6599 [Meripilus lineatus]|uniref:Uncharacterized protein n=1 Tax=Meripilus lineatus TaxID=2056292 RepID=A0AAD5V5Z0_9APHY|nr:hypothetical protein NLI96_g6599 [Physisporinus lineatus]